MFCESRHSSKDTNSSTFAIEEDHKRFRDWKSSFPTLVKGENRFLALSLSCCLPSHDRIKHILRRNEDLFAFMCVFCSAKSK